MSKSFTYYYVQLRKSESDLPEILQHGKDDDTGEVYYEFFDKKQAKKHADQGKKDYPDYQIRIMKRMDTYTEGEWF